MMRFVIPPVLVIALVGGMLLADSMLASPELVKAPFTWFGSIAVVAGLAMAVGHARLFRVLGINIQTFGEPTGLCEQGMFSRTRNPMYLGMVVLLLGTAWWLGSLIAFAGPALFWLAAQRWYIPYEEDQMRRKYGDRYASYCERVPRWIGFRGRKTSASG